eukprot:TRINITY_DN15562_c0_g1_i6.p1 TRINITY_DN15562_c0_g1~~TRINITY_DN15562_c0_g1_i6.p1  ORF type:complete len:423 (-),score=18.49 TRINITY_DN15562_c0_g1_i6:171-1439(-)
MCIRDRFIFSCLLIIFIAFTSQLTAPPDMEEFLPETSLLKKGQDYLKDGRFHSSVNDNLLNVDIIWGIESINRDGTSHWDPEDLGNIVWNQKFNLAAVESQNRLLEICNYFQSSTSTLILENSIDCFLYDFIFWLKSTKGLSYPVQADQFEPLLYEYSLQEIAFTHLTNYRIGFLEKKLKFVSIGLVGSTPFIQARAHQLPIFEKWEEMVEDLNEKSLEGLGKAYQDGGLSWQWMASEKAFIKNAIQGLYLSGTFAFVVLLLFTQNIIITLFCLLSIAGIVCGVLAITKWQGWYLGVMESVNCSIVIGFSVDYIIHIAHSYTKCKDDSRIKKVEFALTHMGISVLGGGITTFGAGVFLLFAELMFFTKMGILLMSTIALSLSWSLIFFPALAQTLGPIKNQGSIQPYTNAAIAWIKKKFKKS